MQTISDPEHGNCMQAAFATLFDKKLEEVPNFIEFGEEWWSEIGKFVKSQGYSRDTILYSNGYSKHLHPECTGVVDEYSISNLPKYEGVNGFFYAVVLSPKYYIGRGTTHAVIVDKNCNIVHDPYYPKGQIYPLQDIIGDNGVIEVHVFDKIVQK